MNYCVERFFFICCYFIFGDRVYVAQGLVIYSASASWGALPQVAQACFKDLSSRMTLTLAHQFSCNCSKNNTKDTGNGRKLWRWEGILQPPILGTCCEFQPLPIHLLTVSCHFSQGRGLEETRDNKQHMRLAGHWSFIS